LKRHMRALLLILGAVIAAVGAMLLAAAVILLNQTLRLFTTHWGIMGIEVNGMSIGNTMAEAGFGVLGVALIFAGAALVRRR
jgi:hypothetical protein